MTKRSWTSPLGNLILIANNGLLVYCNWDSSDCKPKQKAVEDLFKNELEKKDDGLVLDKTIIQLKEFFAGNRREFDIPLELTGSSFRHKIWQTISSIKYGETCSYKELTEKAGYGKAFQAAAKACGANPISIIVPCHRIISSNGKLGGYTGGIDKKIALLNLETPN